MAHFRHWNSCNVFWVPGKGLSLHEQFLKCLFLFWKSLQSHPQPNNFDNSSANTGLPLPLGRGVCETKSTNGRPRPRKPFISRVFCAQRGLTPWSRKVPDHGVGVDLEAVNSVFFSLQDFIASTILLLTKSYCDSSTRCTPAHTSARL